jgi:hypothetical protein
MPRSLLVAVLMTCLLLGAAPYASADARGDCENAVRAKLEKLRPKAKKLQFSSKLKTVSDTKKGREELSGHARYVGAGGQKKDLGWKCVHKGGKVVDVNLSLGD